jgi:hypothetical protein
MVGVVVSRRNDPVEDEFRKGSDPQAINWTSCSYSRNGRQFTGLLFARGAVESRGAVET